ncbi:recombinase family protein [Spirillospora sp. NPDC000708]
MPSSASRGGSVRSSLSTRTSRPRDLNDDRDSAWGVRGQCLDRQFAALKQAGCARVHGDKRSGKNVERAELWKAVEYARPGGTLVVPSLDCLSRSLKDLDTIVAILRTHGICMTCSASACRRSHCEVSWSFG